MNDEDETLEKALKDIFQERGKLKPIPSQQSIEDAIKEGNALIKEENKNPQVEKKKKQSKKISVKGDQNNPYVKAKKQILSKMENWKREEIIQMEKDGDLDNKFYIAFVKEVAILGDSLS